MKKKFLTACIVTLIGGISFCTAQTTDTSTTLSSDFDIQNATTNMQNLKTDLDKVVEQLYALDAKER